MTCRFIRIVGRKGSIVFFPPSQLSLVKLCGRIYFSSSIEQLQGISRKLSEAASPFFEVWWLSSAFMHPLHRGCGLRNYEPIKRNGPLPEVRFRRAPCSPRRFACSRVIGSFVTYCKAGITTTLKLQLFVPTRLLNEWDKRFNDRP